MIKKNIISRLLGYAGNYKYFSIMGCIISGISAITEILPIYYIWKATKEVIISYPNFKDNPLISEYAILAVIWASATLFIYLLGLLLTHLSAFRIARTLRELSLKKLMSLPLGYFTNTGSGKLRQIIEDCAASTETLLAHNLPDLIVSVVSPLTIFTIMFLFDYRLGIVSLLPVIFAMIALGTMMASKEIRSLMGEKQNVLGNLNNEAVEYVRGIPVVKTFNQTIYSFKRFYEAIERYREFTAKVSTLSKWPSILFELFINVPSIFLTIAGIILIGFEPVLNEFFIMFLFGVFLMPLCTSAMYKIMFSSYNTVVSENSLDKIEELLKEDALGYLNETINPTTFNITFKDVTFKYPNAINNALNNINLEIPKGKTYGLVGPSGGGKTTLATLIPRFFDPIEGSVEIGGVNVKDMSQEFLMKNISFVFQQTSLYKMSILDNVKESKPDASEKEVLDALEKAQCMEFINELKDGIHTIYGSKGTYLSGGQAQRIAIARAILKDAPIILLDEATSFTDPENEYEIKKAFEKLTEGKTVLMIAHRLSSIIDSDKIIYLEDGMIKEQGNHQELLDKNGLYKELWDEYQTAFLWKNEGGQN